MDRQSLDGDEAVRSTNDDASICKRFAVHLGYWSDPYLPLLVRNTERKTPEINRGYFARVMGITNLIQKFIKAMNGNCQIVSFGAGFDTLFWKLLDAGLPVKKFVEVDFANVTSRKCHYIKNNSKLMQSLHSDDEEIRYSTSELHSGVYHLVAADLRKLSEVEAKLVACSLEFSVPTLFLFECVLVYMPMQCSHALLQFIADKFSTTFCINYEQVNMTDRFGDVMLSNLKSRGCTLAGVEACSSLKTQEDRFILNGWDGAQALEMNQVYHTLISPSEIHRIEKIEFLDEKELLDQLFHHYCICVAWKDSLDFKLNLLTIH
nr:EOG090X08O3 [Simocephalus serrulatus]